MVAPDRVVVCGFDERGAMYGVHNLEARMDLRQAPYLPRNLNTTRQSLFRARMTLSGLGWMEWPDQYLAVLAALRFRFDLRFGVRESERRAGSAAVLGQNEEAGSGARARSDSPGGALRHRPVLPHRLSLHGRTGKRERPAQAGARHRQRVPRDPRVRAAHRGLLLPQLLRRGRAGKDRSARLGPALGAGRCDCHRGVPQDQSRHRGAAVGIQHRLPPQPRWSSKPMALLNCRSTPFRC